MEFFAVANCDRKKIFLKSATRLMPSPNRQRSVIDTIIF